MPESSRDEDDDDFELELEPIDPEILAVERQRAEKKTDEAVAKVDFDEIERAAEDAGDYYIGWDQLRQFRFTTRHLLIVTAVLAIGLTLANLLGGCMALFVMSLGLIFTSWFIVVRQERRLALERQRRREEFLRSKKAASNAAGPIDEPLPAMPRRRQDFRFAFSLQQVFITVTGAAVLLGLLHLFGPKALTITLGSIAVAGLVVQTFGGFDPPPMVVFGWWVLLLLYLALGLMTAKWPELMSERNYGEAAVAAVLEC